MCGRHKNFNLDAGSVFVQKFTDCGHTICRECYIPNLQSIFDNAWDQDLDEVEIFCFHDGCKNLLPKEVKVLLGDENNELY